MSQRKEIVRICDVCGNEVIAHEEMYIGGHPHNGWFQVHQLSGSTNIEELKRKRDWDVCSVACMKNFDLVLKINI